MHYTKWLAIGAVLATSGWLVLNQYVSGSGKDGVGQTAQYDIETNKPILSGSWIYNAGDCDSKLVLDSVFEINFKENADTKRAGTINTSSENFRIYIDPLKFKDLTERSESAIANCDDVAIPQETPVIATYSPYPLNKKFVYYKNANLLVQVDGEDTFIFRRLSRIREIKAMQNSSDNKTN